MEKENFSDGWKILIGITFLLVCFHIVYYDLNLDCKTETRKIEVKSFFEIRGVTPYTGKIIYCDEGIIIWESIKKLGNIDAFKSGICIEEIKTCKPIMEEQDQS